MSRNSGLKKACLYALPPHQLGYCGPRQKEKSSLISDFINGRETNKRKVRNILDKEFIVSGYYKMIAQAHKLDPFDERVVEAYWLGNELLDKFFEAGKIIPYHLWHVLVVGSISGRIKFDDFKRDQCRISWGRVIKRKPVLIEYQPLKRKEQCFVLKEKIVKEVESDKSLEKGKWVSIHWEKVIEVLSEGQLKNLKKYSRLILKDIYV